MLNRFWYAYVLAEAGDGRLLREYANMMQQQRHDGMSLDHSHYGFISA